VIVEIKSDRARTSLLSVMKAGVLPQPKSSAGTGDLASAADWSSDLLGLDAAPIARAHLVTGVIP
jgi:hypothetical protein